jgi:hypothetical protein
VLTPFEDEAGRHPTKLILLAQRSAGTGPAAFHEAWPALAGTLCRRAGGAAGVAVATTLPETYTTDAPPFDAFAELWWADRRAFDADAGAFGGTADQGVHLHGLLCEEHSVIPAGGYD